MDDEIDKSICKWFRYIKIINKGTDEEENSQLFGAIVGVSNSIQKYKNEKEETRMQQTITEMQTTIEELKATIAELKASSGNSSG